MPATTDHEPRMIKRLNATLPDPLARFVGEVTGDGGLYETPSEFIRDLIRRHMENTRQPDYAEINAMLAASLKQDRYSDWTDKDAQDLLDEIDAP